MEAFVAKVLKMMEGDLSRLGEAFAPRLSRKDELMLTKMDQEIGTRVEGILDIVLAGANHAGEMSMAQQQRDHVMQLTAIRRAIHQLIDERGSLKPFREGLN